MELQETVVVLNFQNLLHSDKSLRTFKISTFFQRGKYKKKIAHLDLCTIIKQLKADVQAVKYKVRFSLFVKYMYIFISYENIK